MLDGRTPLVLDILWFLAHAPEPVTLAEIVSGTGQSRTTVDGILSRLSSAGWVSQEGRPKRFSAGLQVALMGTAVLQSNRVRELGLRYARELAQTVRHSVAIAFYDRGDVIFTDTLEPRGEHFVHNFTGTRLPAMRSASGKILLAYQLEEEIERVAQVTQPATLSLGYADQDAIIAEIHACRDRGYALHANQAQQTGGVSVPVLDQSGGAAFALGLPLLLPIDEATIHRLVPEARMSALRASTELQNRPNREHLIS